MTDGWGNTATDPAAPVSVVVLWEMLRDSGTAREILCLGHTEGHECSSTAVAVPGCPVAMYTVSVHTL